MTFAATRHVTWTLNTPTMRLWPGSVVDASLVYWCTVPRECVWWLQCFGEVNSTSRDLLAGLEGPL